MSRTKYDGRPPPHPKSLGCERRVLAAANSVPKQRLGTALADRGADGI